MVRDTSVKVYKQIMDEGLLSKKRSQVYSILYEWGPMTGGELAKRYGAMFRDASKYSESVRNRITELKDHGVAVEVGKRSCQITGRDAYVWDVTSRLPVKPKKKVTNAELVRRYKKAFSIMAPHVPEAIKELARKEIRGK